MTVHLAILHVEDGWSTACGVDGGHISTTTNPGEVTCLRCRRHRSYRRSSPKGCPDV